MSVTIITPTLCDSNWPYPTTPDGTNASSYDFWFCAGGTNKPDPFWQCAVANAPVTVESRKDTGRRVRVLVYTVTGSESTVTLTLAHPIIPNSLYFELGADGDPDSYWVGNDARICAFEQNLLFLTPVFHKVESNALSFMVSNNFTPSDPHAAPGTTWQCFGFTGALAGFNGIQTLSGVQSSYGFAYVSHVNITGDVLTLTTNYPHSFVAGDLIALSNFTGSTAFLNGQFVTVVSAPDNTHYTAAFTHVDYDAATSYAYSYRYAIFTFPFTATAIDWTSVTGNLAPATNPAVVAKGNVSSLTVDYFSGETVVSLAQPWSATTYVANQAVISNNTVYRYLPPAAWSATASYSSNTWVDYQGQEYYQILSNPPLGYVPPDHPEYWTPTCLYSTTSPHEGDCLVSGSRRGYWVPETGCKYKTGWGSSTNYTVGRHISTSSPLYLNCVAVQAGTNHNPISATVYISSIAVSSNVLTVVTTAAHGLTAGDTVYSLYGGNLAVGSPIFLNHQSLTVASVVDDTTFTADFTYADVPSVSISYTLYKINSAYWQLSGAYLPLSAGTELTATYATRQGDWLDPQISWTGLSSLVGGTGAASVALTPQTYSPFYGGYMYHHSDWLVCRNFGFNLPSNAVIQSVSFAFEGSTVCSQPYYVYTQNAGLLVDNTIASVVYTSDGEGYAGSRFNEYPSGYSMYWDDEYFPGSSEADGTHEIGGSDYYKDSYGTSGGGWDNPWVPSLTPAQVNSSGFGFAIAAKLSHWRDSDPASATANVHNVRMAVYYTLTGVPTIPVSQSNAVDYETRTQAVIPLSRGNAVDYEALRPPVAINQNSLAFYEGRLPAVPLSQTSLAWYEAMPLSFHDVVPLTRGTVSSNGGGVFSYVVCENGAIDLLGVPNRLTYYEVSFKVGQEQLGPVPITLPGDAVLTITDMMKDITGQPIVGEVEFQLADLGGSGVPHLAPTTSGTSDLLSGLTPPETPPRPPLPPTSPSSYDFPPGRLQPDGTNPPIFFSGGALGQGVMLGQMVVNFGDGKVATYCGRFDTSGQHNLLRGYTVPFSAVTKVYATVYDPQRVGDIAGVGTWQPNHAYHTPGDGYVFPMDGVNGLCVDKWGNVQHALAAIVPGATIDHWTPSTTYAHDACLLVVRNGIAFIVGQTTPTGTSGTTEPIWPDVTETAFDYYGRGGMDHWPRTRSVVDGSCEWFLVQTADATRGTGNSGATEPNWTTNYHGHTLDNQILWYNIGSVTTCSYKQYLLPGWHLPLLRPLYLETTPQKVGQSGYVFLGSMIVAEGGGIGGLRLPGGSSPTVESIPALSSYIGTPRPINPPTGTYFLDRADIGSIVVPIYWNGTTWTDLEGNPA